MVHYEPIKGDYIKTQEDLDRLNAHSITYLQVPAPLPEEISKKYRIKKHTAESLYRNAVKAGMLMEKYIVECPFCGNERISLDPKSRANYIGKYKPCPICSYNTDITAEDMNRKYYFSTKGRAAIFPTTIEELRAGMRHD